MVQNMLKINIQKTLFCGDETESESWVSSEYAWQWDYSLNKKVSLVTKQKHS